MIKLVVSDMDGTLLGKSKGVSIPNRNAIQRLSEHNIEFAIASGRDYNGVYQIIHELGIECEAILGNGAQYVDVKGNILMECYMQKTIYKDVVKIFDDASIPYMVFTTKGFYATEPQRVRDLFVKRCVNFFHQPYGEYDKGGKFENSTCNFLQAIGNVDDFLKQDFEIIKVEAFSLDASEIAPAKEKLQFVPMISYLSSFSDNVEVTDQNAQKGLILEKVAKLKNLSKDEIVVIGDGMNDLTMFQHFPYAFAPANADLEIQNLAYQIVADCEDDGFAEVIDIIFKDLM